MRRGTDREGAKSTSPGVGLHCPRPFFTSLQTHKHKQLCTPNNGVPLDDKASLYLGVRVCVSGNKANQWTTSCRRYGVNIWLACLQGVLARCEPIVLEVMTSRDAAVYVSILPIFLSLNGSSAQHLHHRVRACTHKREEDRTVIAEDH